MDQNGAKEIDVTWEELYEHYKKRYSLFGRGFRPGVYMTIEETQQKDGHWLIRIPQGIVAYGETIDQAKNRLAWALTHKDKFISQFLG